MRRLPDVDIVAVQACPGWKLAREVEQPRPGAGPELGDGGDVAVFELHGGVHEGGLEAESDEMLCVELAAAAEVGVEGMGG